MISYTDKTKEIINRFSYVNAGIFTMISFIYGVSILMDDENIILSIIIIIFSAAGLIGFMVYIWSLIILTTIVYIFIMINLCVVKSCSKKIHNSNYVAIV